MRLLSTLLLVAGVAAGDVTRLRELADARQLFQLREALQEPGWNTAETLFYRSMVDSRFGEERKGIDGLTRFVAREPSPAQRRRAFEELAAAFAREGRYGEAARTVAEALRLTPTDEQADNANKRALYAALADIPRQRVTFGRDVPVRAVVNQLGSWDVPVDVNGHRGLWIFDSGANWSTRRARQAISD